MKELAIKVRIFRLDGKTEVKAAGGDNNRQFRVGRKKILIKGGLKSWETAQKQVLK